MKTSILLSVFFSFLLAYSATAQNSNSAENSSVYYELFQNLEYYENVTADPARIQPYKENPRYWQYKEEPVLLIGGSDQDNLFNHPDIWPFGFESHLDLLIYSGGNYVRNTMSSRDFGNEWPFAKNSEGYYDLNTWNERYWNLFREFLDMTYERDIIVQIEIWDRFDFAREPWSLNPFNPGNNINYNQDESTLPEMISTHPGQRENPFFRTTSEQEDNPLVLQYQQAFVDKMISISFDYPNVLYCISNETNESENWSDYWAYYILDKAHQEDVLIFVTEMLDAWDLSDPEHDATFNKPDMYRFVDISQNNHQHGQIHWDNAQKVRVERLSDGLRPVNSVKIYSGLHHGGGLEEGSNKLWRNMFGGFASSRFHRSGPFKLYGIGLSSDAQTQIRSFIMLSEEISFFNGEPDNDMLSDRQENEAYAYSVSDGSHAVYFPDGGEVMIKLSESSGYTIMWLDILNSRWLDKTDFETSADSLLAAPGNGPWAVVIKQK
jgi:hypothetical protein